MGQQPSSEAKGVTCGSCQTHLPANNWKFKESNEYYFYYDECWDKKWIIKYLRRVGNGSPYQCIPCVRKENTKLYRSLRTFAAGCAVLWDHDENLSGLEKTVHSTADEDASAVPTSDSSHGLVRYGHAPAAALAATPAAARLAGVVPTTALFRAMDETELIGTLTAKKLLPVLPSTAKSPNNGLKWVSTEVQPALGHALERKPPRPIVRFDVRTRQYVKVTRDMQVVASYEAKYMTNATRSIRHYEFLNPSEVAKGGQNLGLTVKDQAILNRGIRVKAFKSGEVPTTRIKRFIDSSKLTRGALVLSVVIEGVAIGLSVAEDDGKFGRKTTATLSSSVVGLGASVTVPVLLGSLVPGFGPLAVAVVTGIISTLASIGTHEFVLFCWRDPNTGRFDAYFSSSLNFEHIHGSLIAEADVIFNESAVEFDSASPQGFDPSLKYKGDLAFNEDLSYDGVKVSFGWQHK